MADNTKKYEIVKSDSIVYREKTLYRIRALKDFLIVPAKMVYKGDLGGYVESESNLSQEGYCWVYDDAKVYSNAKVYDNAGIYGNAEIYDNAKVYDTALVCNNAKVYGNASVYGNVEVYDDVQIYGEAEIYGDTKVFGKAKIYDNALVFGNAEIHENTEIYGNAIVSDSAFIYGDAKIYGNAKVNGNAEVFVNAKILDCACVSENAKVFGSAEVFGNAKICNTAWICCIAKIGGKLNLNKGKYIFATLNVDETLSEVKQICEKVDFVNKAIKSNFPVEKNYIRSLNFELAKYDELIDFLQINECNMLFMPKESKICKLLLQSKQDIENFDE